MGHPNSMVEGITGSSRITLREMTSENFESVLDLKVAPGQQEFIATNERSIAKAHFSDQAWYRAIYAGETPIGFVMLADETVGRRANPRCCSLWRLMIDARYQRMGFGTLPAIIAPNASTTSPDSDLYPDLRLPEKSS